jgi:hypothetical protein
VKGRTGVTSRIFAVLDACFPRLALHSAFKLSERGRARLRPRAERSWISKIPAPSLAS